MLLHEIDALITEAMKGGDKVRLETLRLIKTDLTKIAKGEGVTYDEALEKKTLQKMVESYKKAISEYGDRTDLISEATAQLSIIKEFAPQEASNEEIEACTKEVINNYLAAKGEEYKISMRDMKPILAEVIKVYPTANGKIVSQVLKTLC